MACNFSSLLPFLLLFFFALVTSDPLIDEAETNPTDCADRWIHIRRLPSTFNLDLLSNCSAYPIFGDFCPFLPNHGLGHKTHNLSQSWYRTDSLMMELIFHRRMLEYPCLTSDPAQADAVYLPYYSGIDAMKYLYGPEVNSSADQGLELYRFLREEDSPEVWGRHSGHDHFMVMARPAWDFSQPLDSDPPTWGTSLLELPEFFNVTALTVEARAWPWQEQAVPYPTSFHPPNLSLLQSWIQRARRSKRTCLMMFAGGGGVGSGSPNIRRSIRSECENSTSNVTHNVHGNGLYGGAGGYLKLCDVVDCSNGICEHDPIRFMKPMLQASFCLQPPGDTPTRRSIFDSILAGCIPVLFEDMSARTQYGWHMPADQYPEFSVYMPKEDVVFGDTRILDVLRNIPRAKVRKMREKVLGLIPRIMYRKHGSSMGLRTKKDAFDIAIEGVLQRVRSRVHRGQVFVR